MEIIAELKAVVKKLLIHFYKANNKRKPTRIIFYRDGVSEGQFAEVQRSEIPQVWMLVRYPLTL